MTRIVFGISGASGMPLAASVLASLAEISGLEIHLVISDGARRVMAAEGGPQARDFEKYAHVTYDINDLAAAPASGSWLRQGMLVCPCSMATLAAIASGFSANLLHRAADVTLKERGPLVLVPRETPLSLVHLRNMKLAAEANAIIMPFMPAFYAGQCDMPAAMRQFSGRILDQLSIANDHCKRWRETC